VLAEQKGTDMLVDKNAAVEGKNPHEAFLAYVKSDFSADIAEEVKVELSKINTAAITFNVQAQVLGLVLARRKLLPISLASPHVIGGIASVKGQFKPRHRLRRGFRFP